MENKKPKVFLQTRPTTCGVACTMMILNHYFGVELKRSTEGDLRKKLKLNRFDIIPAISLAVYLKEQGLQVFVRHDYPHKFWNVLENIAPEDIVEQMKKKHVVAQEKNITVETGEISSKEIGDRLLEGEFIILGIETVGGIKHAILLYAYENGFVSVIDPLVGQPKETLDDILRCARMDVGTWYISAFRR